MPDNNARGGLYDGRLGRFRDAAMPLSLSSMDRVLSSFDRSLKTLAGVAHATRPMPRPAGEPPVLDAEQRRLSGALMRVNHVGEVCAQALYDAQSLTARDPSVREKLAQASREETDHLAWTSTRLAELGARRSLLNPVWYAGAFAIGLVAGRVGDRASLGFVVETERQVERHLDGHLDRLPQADTASRAIVEVMRDDEARHADNAFAAGGMTLPLPVRWVMRGAAKVMTTTAHYI